MFKTSSVQIGRQSMDQSLLCINQSSGIWISILRLDRLIRSVRCLLVVVVYESELWSVN